MIGKKKMDTKETVEDLLRRTTYRKIDIEKFLDPQRTTWSRFDPELGYVLVDCLQRDGVDGSLTQYRYEPGGHRKMVNYADQPCRLNTYGNSFTQCHQVSDGETWQEQLAAHLREPIRNYGAGGWGAYTAYLQARRVEEGDCGAEYVILNIFDDDHTRNIDATRWIRCRADVVLPNEPQPINGTPWSHLRYDLDKGHFVKRPGLCTSDDDLRALCDPKNFYEAFKDDTIVKLFVLGRGGDVDNINELEALAEAFEITVDLRDPAKRRREAARLHFEYGFRSSQFILEEMRPWLEGLGRKLMVVLTYGGRFVKEEVAGVERFDQRFLDYLKRNNYLYFDSMPAIIDDYKLYNLSLDDYLRQLHIPPSEAAVWSHYNPIANHKFAFWIKDVIVDWLDPKPPAYRWSTT